MCSEYWNLNIEYDCPLCGSHEKSELQTHFMGVPGSCMSHYEIGQPVVELRGIEGATLGPDGPDGFVSICRNCRGYIDWGGRIEDGAVVRVWPYRWLARDDLRQLEPDPRPLRPVE